VSDPETEAGQFRARGYVVRPGLLHPDEIALYRARLERLSGRSAEWFARRSRSWLPGGLRDAWTMPDGVTRTPEFWPLLFHERILDAVRAVIGPEARFLQHTDLHVGFSALAWHRDNVNRRFGEGPDWDEAGTPYRLVRVGLYLQGAQEAGFSLGLVPGSHRHPCETGDAGRLAALAEQTGLLRQACGWLTGHDALSPDASWVVTEPGDAILFDPRILHAGSAISGPKYSMFVAYGVPGPHFDRHYLYYRHVRTDLGYQEAPSQLRERLGLAGLAPAPPAQQGPVASAWSPSTLQRRLARPFRSRPA